MQILYTDASFDWTSTEATKENVVRGKIAVSDGKGFERIEQVVVGKVEGLQQYINVLELTAIARAVELASLEEKKSDVLTIFTDSKTAMAWARKGRISNKVATVAHSNAIEYLRLARIQFGGEVVFDFVPREENHAGFLLQAELDAGRNPHDVVD